MKLRAPEGCGAASLEGRPLTIAPDGSVEIDAGAASALAAHGFVPWVESPGSRDTIVASRDAAGVPARPAPSCVDIASMNRPQLFAFLRTKGVSVSLPITNAALRAAASRVAAK